jgi:hypothetical protein
MKTKMDRSKKTKSIPRDTGHTVMTDKIGKPLPVGSKMVSGDSQKPKITHEMIAQRAWAIWISKGCRPGQDEMNWYQAELELTNGMAKKGDVFGSDEE